MSAGDLARARAAEAAEGRRDWEPNEEYGLGDLVIELRAAQRWRDAWVWTEQQLRAEVGERIGEGGAFRLGNLWVRSRRSWTEPCIDPAGFWDWVRRHGEPSILFNPGAVRRGQLPRSVRSTFYERIPGPYDVEIAQIEGNPRVPPEIAELPEGTLLYGRRRADDAG